MVEVMAAAWRRGERPTADEVLARHPGLGDEAAVRLIYEEVCLRREAGLDVETSEVVRRYPRWRVDLEAVLGFDRMIRPDGPARAVEYPEAGARPGLLDAPPAAPADRGRGRDLLDALDRLGAAAPAAAAAPAPAAGPFRQFLDGASYVQAACWVAACLADALQYAHDRGLVHMD